MLSKFFFVLLCFPVRIFSLAAAAVVIFSHIKYRLFLSCARHRPTHFRVRLFNVSLGVEMLYVLRRAMHVAVKALDCYYLSPLS